MEALEGGARQKPGEGGLKPRALLARYGRQFGVLVGDYLVPGVGERVDYVLQKGGRVA